MDQNAKEFARENHVSYTTVCRWIRKGYLGNLERDPKTKQYIIPKAMPLPYTSGGRTQRDRKLIGQLIDAADLGRSVHPTMFPKVSEERYQRCLSYVVSSGLVESLEICPGVVQLVSTENGREFLAKADKDKDNIIAIIGDSVRLCLTVAQLLSQLAPFFQGIAA